ncbi:MAG: hypothetical protein ACLT2T_11990 [Bilophila wadsworthia]
MGRQKSPQAIWRDIPVRQLAEHLESVQRANNPSPPIMNSTIPHIAAARRRRGRRSEP